MTIRASFPFTVASGATPSVSATPDGASRVPASTFAIAVTDATTVQAMVEGIVTVDTSNSSIVLEPSNPLDLTGGLGRYGAVAIDAIVYGGVPIDEAKSVVVVKPDGSARNFVDPGPPPSVGDANADDWASGSYGVYVKRGDPLWRGTGSASTSLALTITLIVRSGADEYQLDGRELLRAINSAESFDPVTPVPSGIFDDTAPSTILVIGPTPAAGATPIIESVVCGATSVEVFGPAADAALPSELVYLAPSSGALDITLSGGATADWSATVQNAPGFSLATASGTADLSISNITWTTLPSSLQSQEAVTCTITATPTGSAALNITVMGLAHPPVIDTGRAARASVPLEGSPRVSVRVDDCDSPAPSAFIAGATVKVGMADASDPAVSPDGQRLYFAVPGGTAGTVDLNLTNGDGSVAQVTGGLTYVEDIGAGFEGLKAALAVAAEEAAEKAQDTGGSDIVPTFCTSFRPYVIAYQVTVAAMLPRISSPDDTAAWQQLMANQAQFVIDTVNEAVATLDNPPVASFDGQPFASSDDQPDYDVGAYVIMMTALDCVVVRSSIGLIAEG